MEVRIRIRLGRHVLLQARSRAAKLGVPLGEYLGRLIQRDLATTRASAERKSVFALGKSGATELSRDKDRLLAEAFARRRPATR